jgi:cytoskeletal protein RodZ
MSRNTRKKATKSPHEVEDTPMARIVAISKTPEQAANAPVKPESKAAKPKSDRIGDILRHARLERNDDLYQIAEYLCIKPAFLVALENSRYDEFPADAYVIGFLRTYATFLGVDGKDAVDRYRYEMAGRRKKPVLAMPIPLTEGRAPSSLIMVGATVAALLIYVLWYGISSSNRTEVHVPPPLPTAQQIAPATAGDNAAAGLTSPLTPPAPLAGIAAPQNASPTIPPAAPGIVVMGSVPAATTTLGKGDTKAEPLKDESTDKTVVEDKSKDSKDDSKPTLYGDPGEAAHLMIRATQNTWVQITDPSGKTVFNHALKVGDTYKVPNKPGLMLATGNGNALVLSLDGSELPKIAIGAAHVVKNIPLDTDRLTTDPSAQ